VREGRRPNVPKQAPVLVSIPPGSTEPKNLPYVEPHSTQPMKANGAAGRETVQGTSRADESTAPSANLGKPVPFEKNRLDRVRPRGVQIFADQRPGLDLLANGGPEDETSAP